MRKNCSSDREKLLEFEAEFLKFGKLLRSLGQFIRIVKDQKKNFTGSWRFLLSNELQQYSNSNWKKILGFRNMQEKLENLSFLLHAHSTQPISPYFFLLRVIFLF